MIFHYQNSLPNLFFNGWEENIKIISFTLEGYTSLDTR